MPRSLPVNALELHDVRAHYGRVPVLSSVSLHLEELEIVALMGSNGAGKTSTLKSIYGLLPISAGKIHYRGADIRHHSPQQLVRNGLCYVPEGGRVFVPMTVMDNLVLGGFPLRGLDRRPEWKRNLDLVYTLFPVLKKSRKRRAGTLSGGERQMLALARALMASPQVLLLDEPSLGLAPLMITEVMKQIKEMRRRGLSVLLVEQNARAALRIADRGYVMEGGCIFMEGTTEKLLADNRVASAYLGGR